MNWLNRRFAFLLAPVLTVLAVAVLVALGLTLAPATVTAVFEQDGDAPVELATVWVFAAVIPLVWAFNPFGGSRVRRTLLALAVTSVTFFAICKENDWHIAAFAWAYPDVVANFTGTPFKMRFLTCPTVPFGAKALVVFYFAAFFGVFAAGFAYLFRTFLRGVRALDPVSWAFGCFGATGIFIHITDRLPAWWRHAEGLTKAEVPAEFAALCAVLEEGSELLLALLAVLVLLLAAHKRRGASPHLVD